MMRAIDLQGTNEALSKVFQCWMRMRFFDQLGAVCDHVEADDKYC
jgi:hypothetical protein